MSSHERETTDNPNLSKEYLATFLDRVEAVSKVKVPLFTLQQVAEFFKAGTAAVQKSYQQNMAEPGARSVVFYRPKQVDEQIGQNVQFAGPLTTPHLSSKRRERRPCAAGRSRVVD